MVSPITVGVTPIVVAPRRRRRADIRFQNVGATTINLKKIPLEGAFTPVSISDFEVQLFPGASTAEAGEAFTTDSIASFMAVSSAAGGSLSIYETFKI